MKAVRRDPEKRRLQNIQAQKRYREKLRERIKALEASAASAIGSTSAVEAVTYSSVPTIPTLSVAIRAENEHLSPLPDGTPSALSSVLEPLPGEWQYQIPQSDENPSEVSSWDCTTYINPSLLIRDNQNIDRDPYSTTTIRCGCSIPHIHIQTQGPDPFNYDNIKILSFGHTAADPYSNHIRIETLCIAAAMYTLVNYLGINEDLFCRDDSPSPFFRSSTESADEAATANTVSIIQKTFKTMKPDLRPRSEQITIRHHPYIDILPFPTLRKNLITCQAEINEDEFFDDMLTGLVCWGGAGIGRKDRDNSTEHVSSGTPWDLRSWEGKVWFLRKYWDLFGGEDGELVRQSEWWRSMRGDDMEIRVDGEFVTR